MAIGFGIKYEIFPPLIFMGVGAMTDFAPLIANPKTMLLGAAAQIGVFVALAGAMLLGFNVQEAASIGIIGGADGPTAIYLTSKLAPHLLGAIAVAAYSYMSLVPLIQPPIKGTGICFFSGPWLQRGRNPARYDTQLHSHLYSFYDKGSLARLWAAASVIWSAPERQRALSRVPRRY